MNFGESQPFASLNNRPVRNIELGSNNRGDHRDLRNPIRWEFETPDPATSVEFKTHYRSVIRSHLSMSTNVVMAVPDD